MIVKHISFFLFFLIFLFTSLGFSQNNSYEFNHISTSKGLSQSSVIAIYQDKQGQMWFGTRDGLNKYDGHKFTVYRTVANDESSLSNNDITSITEDSFGNIWIGTYRGLNKYDPITNSFQRFLHKNESNSLINNTVWTIKEMSNKEIWIGTSKGLSIYNQKTQIFTNILSNPKNENSLSNNYIKCIVETDNKEIYIGNLKGLSKLESRVKDNLKFLNFSSKKVHIGDILEYNDKLLLATRNQGVLIANQQTKTLEQYNLDIEKNLNVRKLEKDNNNNLWVGTYNGLYIIDDSKRITKLVPDKNNPKSLSKKSVKSIFKDKKGSIWIGTYYGGLNFWDETNANFNNYTSNTKTNSLSYSVISSIDHYQNDLLFFGTEGNGITILNKKSNAVSYLNQNTHSDLTANNIKSLLIDEELLWIGTYNAGVNLYDIKKKKLVNEIIDEQLRAYLSKLGVYSIRKSKNSLYFGTFKRGLVVYNKLSKNIKYYLYRPRNKNSITSNLTRTIIIDSKNNIWLGTQRGLSKIDKFDNVSRYFYDENNNSGNDITTIFEDINGVIWVGTRSLGLYKYENGKFLSFKLIGRKGSISNVHSIEQDNNSNLWLATNQGIIKYNPQENKTVAFNLVDGLVGNEYNDNASLKLGDSRFYFGGPNGITSFDTNSVKKNTYSPQVLITNFKLKGKSVLFQEEIKLDHDQGNFSLEFAIPNYIHPKNNTYKYRLKGLDKDWQYTSSNTASYTIQKSGNYIFEIKGANNDGVWNSSSTNLSIYVKPAPWRTWWAFTIYGLVIITALYFLIYILQSKTKLKLELALEHKENEKIEKENKAKLEFFTNISHEFRTPLTLILGPLNQVLEDYKGSSSMYKKLLVVQNSANHLLTLINRLMDFRKLEKNLFKLEAAEGNIVKFVKEIYLSFTEYAKDGGYDYSFHTTDEEILVYYDRYKLERVFYNLISNAFRYTAKNGTIAIRLKVINDNIIISVEDSGVGIAEEYKDKIFERFFEVEINNKRNKNYNKGTGIGLSIAKNIVNLHKGKIGVKNNKNDEGSIFSVELPLGKNHLTNQEIIKDFKFSDDISQYVKQLDHKDKILEEDFEDAIIKENQKTILLVEDSLELRSFMKDLLKNEYNILEAENGRIAFNMAIKHTPDLIVSDVVMPVMVGTELCAAIKNELKTSHIPIVLLTSRSALIYKLEGLESGADDYISKPFDINEFKLRIKNILQSSNTLKEKFSDPNRAGLNNVLISSLDDKLYKKALKIIEDNISNENFDIPFFCSELGVSRTMLFLKIKAWTNFTPNDFIQHFRMKRAAQLLEKGKINISEVSYKVGFKNPKYFSKCFQKKYGETPRQYSKKFSDY